jgi:hypothetical protein
MSRIKVIQHEAAEGRLKEIYDGIVESRGQFGRSFKNSKFASGKHRKACRSLYGDYVHKI